MQLSPPENLLTEISLINEKMAAIDPKRLDFILQIKNLPFDHNSIADKKELALLYKELLAVISELSSFKKEIEDLETEMKKPKNTGFPVSASV